MCTGFLKYYITNRLVNHEFVHLGMIQMELDAASHIRFPATSKMTIH